MESMVLNEKDFATRFWRDFETFEVAFAPFRRRTESIFQSQSLIFLDLSLDY